MAKINAKFNNYSLQNVNIITRIIQHANLPEKKIIINERIIRDGSIISNIFYSRREIELEGSIKGDSQEDLHNKIDALKENLQENSGDLDIDYGGTIRRYKATVKSIEIGDDFYNINIVPYRVNFICEDPFGYLTNSGIVNLTGITSLNKSIPLTISGNYLTPLVAKLVFNSASGVDMITIRSVEKDDKIIISKPSGDFIAGDEVLVDGINMTCYINSSGIDYTGIFPQLKENNATIEIILNGSSVNYNLTIQYPPRYL